MSGCLVLGGCLTVGTGVLKEAAVGRLDCPKGQLRTVELDGDEYGREAYAVIGCSQYAIYAKHVEWAAELHGTRVLSQWVLTCEGHPESEHERLVASLQSRISGELFSTLSDRTCVNLAVEAKAMAEVQRRAQAEEEERRRPKIPPEEMQRRYNAEADQERQALGLPDLQPVREAVFGPSSSSGLKYELIVHRVLQRWSDPPASIWEAKAKDLWKAARAEMALWRGQEVADCTDGRWHKIEARLARFDDAESARNAYEAAKKQWDGRHEGQTVKKKLPKGVAVVFYDERTALSWRRVAFVLGGPLILSLTESRSCSDDGPCKTERQPLLPEAPLALDPVVDAMAAHLP